MGGKSSKCSKRNRCESHTTRYRDTPVSPYAQPSYNFPPPTPNQRHNAPANSQPQRPAGNKYSRIDDEYHSLDQVTRALARAGLESSNLIVGIDFTKSNEWTGRRSFRKKCLHHIGEVLNPYEQAISIIGKTLSKFDEDNLIPCFGFGDATTHDQDVFSFYPDYSFCDGFEDVLRRYRFLAPQLQLAGPTSFAPIIEMAITIVEQSGGQYHVLLIIADGQVTRSVDTSRGQLSPQEKKTIEAIVKASEYPLSIILVGVGDGPWDMMKEFDDNLPARAFDNFQFVNFTKIMSKDMDRSCKEAEFALSALMEIPSQYKATLELNLLGSCIGKGVDKIPLPPPQNGTPLSSFGTPDTLLCSDYHRYPSVPPSPNYRPSVPPSPYGRPSVPPSPYHRPSVPPSPLPHGGEQNGGMCQFDNYYAENHLCLICFIAPKDMAFGCGHQTCCECGKELQYCPICRSIIQTRIKLYN